MSVQDTIREQVTSHPVVLYMKGSPQFPQCGFSATATQLLKMSGAENLFTVDVLQNPRSARASSSSPTGPRSRSSTSTANSSAAATSCARCTSRASCRSSSPPRKVDAPPRGATKAARDVRHRDRHRARQGRAPRRDRRHGLHSESARRMGMSYRRAWLLVDTMNRCFREPVVASCHGRHWEAAARRSRPSGTASSATSTPCGHASIARSIPSSPASAASCDSVISRGILRSMDPIDLLVCRAVLRRCGVLYSTVGHAGASGYLG